MLRAKPKRFGLGREWRLGAFDGDVVVLRTFPRSGNHSPYSVGSGAVVYEAFPSPLNFIHRRCSRAAGDRRMANARTLADCRPYSRTTHGWVTHLAKFNYD